MRLATITTPAGTMTRPVGLDFTAILLAGAARGVDLPTLSAVLPRVEAAIINPPEAGDQQGDDDDDDA